MVEKDSPLCASCLEGLGASRDACSLRCVCGCLLAKLVSGGVELKCRRCKQICFIPFENMENESPLPASS